MKAKYGMLIIVALISVAMATGCGSSVAKKTSIMNKSQEDLRSYARSVLNDEEYAVFEVPYEIDSSLGAFAATAEDRKLPDLTIAKQLALKLLLEGGEGLGIKYSNNKNYTAKEVYQKREANCISFTNLYVGMARSIGLNVNFIEVTEVESFDKIGNNIVYNSHICAVIFRGPNPYVLDFSLRKYPQYHSWRTISDVEAAASFYNNKGSDILITNESLAALDKAEMYFTMATKLYPQFAQAYNNLGVLKMRQFEPEQAEKMYLKALEIKPGYFAAYNNLSKIYVNRGEMDRAVNLMKEAITASPKNHFAYLNLAKMYISSKDYQEAENVLQLALVKKKDFTEARHELGRLMLRTGRSGEAKRQFALALKYQPDDSIARNKMDLIEQLTAK